MHHILLVEDEPEFAASLQKSLERNSYLVTSVSDGEAALQAIEHTKFDLVLLDLGLPDPVARLRPDPAIGRQVCQRIRDTSNVPILILTIHNDPGNEVMALDMGANGYIFKLVPLPVLLAHIRAAIRPNDTKILKVGDVEIDLLQHRVSCNGKKVMLAAREVTLLHFMMSNPRQYFQQDKLMRVIDKSPNEHDPRYMDQLIHLLRGKLREVGSDRVQILNERNQGYAIWDIQEGAEER